MCHCAIELMCNADQGTINRTNSHSLHLAYNKGATMSAQEPEDLWLFGYG